MERTMISSLYPSPAPDIDEVHVCGWARTVRDSKAIGFIELNDGSCFKGVQIVFEQAGISNFAEIAKLNVGSSVRVTGRLVLTPEGRQPFEIHADSIEIEGESAAGYPLQKKKHS
ncbi:MAG: OB-fold nucleic acid binding domain-containing protein, partial [Oscillospiraceae bacterium]|nr:OB-fold nucleic acid binding domain-containing protein [Oscillospiraceae bacterium]